AASPPVSLELDECLFPSSSAEALDPEEGRPRCWACRPRAADFIVLDAECTDTRGRSLRYPGRSKNDE
ncbi:hypothetical protein TGPRC2_422960, partial [Toxoplasma gondii TgCatPRC2]